MPEASHFTVPVGVITTGVQLRQLVDRADLDFTCVEYSSIAIQATALLGSLFSLPRVA